MASVLAIVSAGALEAWPAGGGDGSGGGGRGQRPRRRLGVLARHRRHAGGGAASARALAARPHRLHHPHRGAPACCKIIARRQDTSGEVLLGAMLLRKDAAFRLGTPQAVSVISAMNTAVTLTHSCVRLFGAGHLACIECARHQQTPAAGRDWRGAAQADKGSFPISFSFNDHLPPKLCSCVFILSIC